MRKIFAFEMVSLDGYYETGDRGLDWHHVDAEFADFAAAQLDEADALLFGRVTYQMMAEYWPTEARLQDDPEIAKRMNQLSKVVVSRTLPAAGWGPATVISADVAAEVGRLKQQPGRDIALIGSSALAASLLGEGLLDELRIMVNPVILGAGRTLLAGAHRAELRLSAVRQFGSGNVLLTYQTSQPAS
jgi:dihydrofolate reductase